MKTSLSRLSLALLLALCFGSFGVSALAQGSAFTYQGRLNNGANPANGNYDLRFQLYSAATGGSLIAGPVTNAPVTVSNGLFTTLIDFGPGVFVGSTNWLQIGVRSNGVAVAYTVLSPRQQLTPTPYAIYSETADAGGLAGTIPAGALSGVSGTGLTGLALLAGGNTFTGGNQSIDGMLDIDAGIGAATNYDDLNILGAFNDGEEHSLNFNDGSGHVASVIGGFQDYTHGGYVSIGNLWYEGVHPTYAGETKAFTVFGDGDVVVDPMNLNQGYIDNNNTNSSGLTFGLNSGEGIASQRVAGGGGANQYGLDFYTSFNKRMSIRQNGFVGIGTQSQVDGDELFGVYSPVTNTFAGTYVETGVGGRPFYGFSQGGGDLTWTEQDGQANDNWEVWVNNSFKLAITTAGNVGIGTQSPGSALEVASGNAALDNGDLYIASANSTGITNLNNSYGLAYRSGITTGICGNGPILYGFNGGALAGLAPNTIALSWDYQGNIWVNNNASVGTLTIRGGADLAEPFKMSETSQSIPQGSVVVIDDQNPGRLKLSDSPYDTRVAGVVSGANGVNPGIQMHQDGVIEGGKNVSLSGRVYVQADTSNGAIRPGDMLTTSSIPGHAMKVSDHARAAGAILGKAMTGLSEGKGMVLVLVTLQ